MPLSFISSISMVGILAGCALLLISYNRPIPLASTNVESIMNTYYIKDGLRRNLKAARGSSCAKAPKVMKMSENFFQLYLQDDEGKQLILTYKLKPNSVSMKFVTLVKKILTESVFDVRYTSWGVYPKGEGVLIDLCKALTDNMKYFNQHNKIGMEFKSSYPDPATVSKYHLNDIHSEFEKLMTQSHNVLTGDHNLRGPIVSQIKGNETTNDPNVEKSLNAVNGLVHALEHVLNRGPDNSASFFTAYLNSAPLVNPIPLEPDDYCLFTLESHFGDLLLGYGTTGKSLYHLYKDNDLKLIENGGRPSPQQFVTSNILGSFYHTLPHAEELKNILTWTRQNHIEEKLGIDATAMENAHGYVKLGKLLILPEWRNKTENEIIGIISPYHTVTAYKIMERF